MVLVPAGDFLMGSSEDEVADAFPQHVVPLDSYWMDIYEVTNEQYHKCVDVGACYEPEDLRYFNYPEFASHPVVYITWFDALAFCRWNDKRLPTEAEWEKAARGGRGRRYPWGDDLATTNLNAGSRLAGTTPVGSYSDGASPYGAMDMAGNVWEWVMDWYEPYPGTSFIGDFFGDKYKVLRGGSWNHPDRDARTFYRDIAHPNRTFAVVGFRCAADG